MNINDACLLIKMYVSCNIELCLCRLGGLPVGVICVETRTTELTIPADPANLDSEVKVCVVVL